MNFTITIETNTTSESLSTHELLFDAMNSAYLYSTDYRRIAEYSEIDNANIVIWQGEHLVELIPFN
jgi:hypothetical protein